MLATLPRCQPGCMHSTSWHATAAQLCGPQPLSSWVHVHLWVASHKATLVSTCCSLPAGAQAGVLLVVKHFGGEKHFKCHITQNAAVLILQTHSRSGELPPLERWKRQDLEIESGLSVAVLKTENGLLAPISTMKASLVVQISGFLYSAVLRFQEGLFDCMVLWQGLLSADSPVFMFFVHTSLLGLLLF